MDTAKTGAYLASLRKNAGMTQQDAADRLGVSNKTVSKWESGGGFPDITVLPALAELYGVTADDILAGAAVRSSGGDSQVAQYLARRGELRWRIGFSTAALFLLAATMFYAYAWSWLLLAGGAASVWVGWGRCDGDVLRRRLVMLLPWAMLVLYFLLVRFQLPFRLARHCWRTMQTAAAWCLIWRSCSGGICCCCCFHRSAACCGPRRCGGVAGGICCPVPIPGSWPFCG